MTEAETARLYNEMAEDYDDIQDLWYSWLFSRLHYFIAKFLESNSITPPRDCLDVGCGTGFQTILLSLCGFNVTGVDISSELVEKARGKDILEYLSIDLFQSRYPFVSSYSEKVRTLAQKIRGTLQPAIPAFEVGSATRLPFSDQSFDLVNCCGSTLSAIEDYKTALSEMTRVLRPGGVILLEVENRYNMDLLWPLVDTLVGGRIGYDQELRISLSNLLHNPLKHVKTDFPLSTHNGEVLMPIWLFSSRTLIALLRERGITIEEIHAIHSVTNIVPSVTLDRFDPPSRLVTLFNLLSRFETVTSSLPPFRRLGCSVVIFGRKG
jgi:ubiquinone/menaquinone biosynthesis C-methylase UbiE